MNTLFKTMNVTVPVALLATLAYAILGDLSWTEDLTNVTSGATIVLTVVGLCVTWSANEFRRSNF